MERFRVKAQLAMGVFFFCVCVCVCASFASYLLMLLPAVTGMVRFLWFPIAIHISVTLNSILQTPNPKT